MKKYFSAGCLLLSAAVLCAQPPKGNAVAQYVAGLRRDTLFRHASVSLLVMDAATKKVIASWNPHTALLPASTVKLVTTGLAITALGSDYRYRTTLACDGTVSDSTLSGNLYIVGGGDPTFGAHEPPAAPVRTVFEQWTTALKAAGIQHIAGDLVADETFFAPEELPESWAWGDIGNAYGAGVSGLPFCENAYLAVLSSGRSAGDSTTLRSVYPYFPEAVFHNKVITGKAGSRANTLVYHAPASSLHTLRGTIPPRRDSVAVKGANTQAAYSCIWQFYEYLHHRGITLSGTLRVLSEMPAAAPPRTVIAVHSSPALKEIAGTANRKSHNFYAETLLKTLGKTVAHGTSYEASLDAVARLLDSLHIPQHGVQLRDGSGLSRKNYAPAQFFCDYLLALYRSGHYRDFVHTLAVPGDRGTLQNLLPRAPHRKRLHAKSGSMEGVRAYAGYSHNPNGTLVFAILINNFNYPIATLQPKVEQLLQAITEY